jgi:hypothetical protein
MRSDGSDSRRSSVRQLLAARADFTHDYANEIQAGVYDRSLEHAKQSGEGAPRESRGLASMNAKALGVPVAGLHAWNRGR